MNYFENKIIWVTGASSGIGEEMCKQLANHNSILILSARTEETLIRIKSSLKNSDKHLVLPLDLEKTETFKPALNLILNKFGRLDMLFNNGGVSQRSEVYKTSLEVDRKIMEINYFGNIALSKIVLPHFQEQKSGHFVITSSIAGKFGFYLRSAYSAAKHALHGYYESLALENIKNNISITILCPGKINTPISTNALRGDGMKHNIMDHNQETGMPVDECVRQILHAVSKKKREVLVGNKEILTVYIKRFFPSLFWKIIQKQKAT
jgi:dehydrogenase/reductase SDR family protein 7B